MSQPASPWSRRQLRAALLATLVVVLVLGYGLGYGLWRFFESVTGGGPDAGSNAAAPSTSSPQLRRDAAAASPMHRVDADAARPAAPAARAAPTIRVPAATTAGPSDVPSGFPQTPEGAIGQLAAIDTTVLTAMSIETTRAVHAAWAAPGAVSFEDWELTRSIRAFLGSAHLPDSQAAVIAITPAAAQVKAQDGPDWVVACVLYRIRAVVKAEANAGFGHCERMTWQAGRWVIAPGPAPARAPSTWPGSDVAAAAGWRTWVGAEDLT